MQRLEVETIFEQKKLKLLDGLIPVQHPVAILLGGQPASGKSQLAVEAEENQKGLNFLKINGDLYREFHPQYKKLTQDIFSFSEETQIFSNVFTEKLIEEAQKNKFNVIVEGTMRNKAVDKIFIYTYGAKEKVQEYTLIDNSWTCSLSPANIIKQSRENQLKDKFLLHEIKERGETTLKIIRSELHKDLSSALDKLNNI
jgi:adenylate kinase family enzyme